eukprot:5952791-Amphidinium_carterae.1
MCYGRGMLEAQGGYRGIARMGGLYWQTSAPPSLFEASSLGKQYCLLTGFTPVPGHQSMLPQRCTNATEGSR